MVILSPQNRNRGKGLQLRKNLIEYWPLDEASGTRRGAVNGLNLTDNNTVTGNSGTCDSLSSQFTAANSEVLTRNNESALQLGNIDFSFSFWVYLDSKPGVSFTFFSKSIDDNNRELLLQWVTGTDIFRCLLYNGSNTVVGNVTETNLGAPSLSTWYMLTVVHNSVAQTISIAANLNNFVTVSRTGTPGVTTGDFRIGSSNTPGFQYWDGRIQRVGFWKRILTPEERTFLYNNGCGRDWPFYAD